MSTVIRDSSESSRMLRIYDVNTNNAQKRVMRLSSGIKINSAGDDPSGLAITERMREKIRSLDQANRNVQNDTSLMRTAESAINNTIEILHTLRERAVNSANDTNTDAERSVIQKEVEQYLWQIDNNATTTSFSGQKLLDGTKAKTGLNFHIGGEANFSVNLKLEDMTVKGLGLENLNLSTREGAQRALGVWDEDEGKWVESKTITDASGNETTIYGLLDTALKKALEQQASLGAMEERLGFVSDGLISASENIQAAESSMLDTNMAEDMTDYVKYNILIQATQHMLAQQNQNAANVNELLQPISA